jgi:hypothetical protein
MKIAILFASFAGASAFVSQAPKSTGCVHSSCDGIFIGGGGRVWCTRGGNVDEERG